jgi:hypothetical protein
MLDLDLSLTACAAMPPLSAAVPISAPATFAAAGDTIPFTISRTGSAISTNYSADATRPTPATTFYVSTTGAINNDGLTPGAVRSIAAAVAMAQATGGVCAIKIAGGKYRRANGTFVRTASPGAATYRANLNNATLLNSDIILESSDGQRWFSTVEDVYASPSFAATADPNIWVATYTTEAPGILTLDWNNLDADGIPRMLAPLIAAPASAAAPWPEINALWTLYSGIKDKPTDAGTYSMGASWLDTTNKKIYVRTFDNRHPTGLNSDIDNLSNLSTLRGAETALTANHTIWMRGGCFMGGFNGAMVAASTNTSRLTYYADDMVFYGGYGFGAFTTIIAGASATAGGTKSVLNNCKAYYALLDGFNYHGNGTVATATSPFGIEIGCKSKWCGWTTGLANNGTTCHEACRLLCINSEYLNAQDRTINDIQSAMRWMLGCAGSTRRTADASVQSRIVCAQLSGNPGTCTIWLDTFTPLDGAFGPPQAQYEANTVTTAIGVVNFATNMSLPSAPSGGGTFAAYTP